MKTKLNVHPLLGLVFILVVIAAFVTIPVIAFYVLPKALIWAVNYLISFVGWHVPFNLFTWAIAMYLFWITGVVRLTTRGLKTAVGQIKAKAAAK